MVFSFYGLLPVLFALNAVTATDYASDPVVQLFQQYLQIDTTTGNDLTPGVDFWKALAAEEDLPIYVYEFVEGYPVTVIKWAGTNSTLSSIMLNSHMDVVPAKESDGWLYPPFAANITDSGDIYARGTQDMKSVAIQYFEALRRLKANNVSLLRDVYMTFMPDEEVGGLSGMSMFLQSDEFAALNVGFALDEGRSLPIETVPIFYHDKPVWQIQVDCYGVAAHGSLFIETNYTAVGQCYNAIAPFMKLRQEQYEIAKTADSNNAGTYTSVNLNKLSGGTANNVIPNHVSLTFDIRLATNVNVTKFDAQLKEWIAEAGQNITLTYILNNPQTPATIVNDTNPYWVAMYNGALSQNITIVPNIPPGSTDSRYVRKMGIPAFGFSPMPNTPVLGHAVNEYLNAGIFLKGIDVYEQIIQNLANLSECEVSEDPSVYLYTTPVED